MKNIRSLLALRLSKGIQPSEMADAIFESDYEEINIEKAGGHVCMEVSFYDEDAKHTMRYTYDQDRYILMVEQKVGGKDFCVQWDRSEVVNKLKA